MEDTLEYIQDFLKTEIFVNSEFAQFVQSKSKNKEEFKYFKENEFVMNFKRLVNELELPSEIVEELEDMYLKELPKNVKNKNRANKWCHFFNNY